jgi:hypothetical protein
MNKLVSLLVLAISIAAFATPVNITVTGTTPIPYTWPSGGSTVVPPGDNEVLPDNLLGNNADLEAMLLDGSQLSLVASYDLKNGTPGDLFLALNGDTKYDYALRFDFTTSNYDVYQIAPLTTLFTNGPDMDGKNAAYASPFQVVASTATDIGSFDFTYKTGLADNAALGYTSWPGYGTTTHNEITEVNLADFLTLSTGEEIATHFTIGCGNDELNGHGRIPEPGSMSMILVGLLSLVGLAV